MNSPQPPTPECDKLLSVTDESEKITNFIDWMIAKTDCRICFRDVYDDGHYYSIGHGEIENMLAKYFDIDLDKVEKERTTLIKWIRENVDSVVVHKKGKQND